MIGERVLVMLVDGLPAIMRVECILTIRVAVDGEAFAVVADVKGAPVPIHLAGGLDLASARWLWGELRQWMSGRAGFGATFDLDAEITRRQQLARAGSKQRSTRRA